MLDDKGEFDQSIAAYDKILAIAPDEGRALNGRAWGYAQKGELDWRSTTPSVRYCCSRTSRMRCIPAPGST